MDATPFSSFEAMMRAASQDKARVVLVPKTDPRTNNILFTAYRDLDAAPVFEGLVIGHLVRPLDSLKGDQP